MRTFMWLNEQVCACKMATGCYAPQGVENVHTLCAGKPESDDRGYNISVKRLCTSSDRCIERYIKTECYYYYYRKNWKGHKKSPRPKRETLRSIKWASTAMSLVAFDLLKPCFL